MADETTRDAVHGNRLNDLKILVEDEEWPIDLNKPDEHGWTYLMYAVRYSLLDIAIYLMDNGADVHKQKPGDGNAVIHIAAREGDLAMLKLLLSRGASAVMRNASGVQPYSIATSQGHEGARLLLLEAMKEPLKIEDT